MRAVLLLVMRRDGARKHHDHAEEGPTSTALREKL